MRRLLLMVVKSPAYGNPPVVRARGLQLTKCLLDSGLVRIVKVGHVARLPYFDGEFL